MYFASYESIFFNGVGQITCRQCLCSTTSLQSKQQNQGHSEILPRKHKVIPSPCLSTGCRAHSHTGARVSHLLQLFPPLTQLLPAQSRLSLALEAATTPWGDRRAPEKLLVWSICVTNTYQQFCAREIFPIPKMWPARLNWTPAAVSLGHDMVTHCSVLS